MSNYNKKINPVVDKNDIPVVILCGGKGTRLKEYTDYIPKPLIEIGGHPILWHIMKLYSYFGFNNFILCLGHMGDEIKKYFLKFPEENWNIIFADTGLETNTGGRIKLVEPYIKGETFMVTYGDGLADIDLNKLLIFHQSYGHIATLTVVNPKSSFGILECDETGKITKFQEKPFLDYFVNGGFFIFNRKIFKYLDNNPILERDTMERLIANREIFGYKHKGFWCCMDTYKDTIKLNKLWSSGQAKWEVWEL